MKKIITATAVLALTSTALVASPSHAAVYIDSPCRITVPSKVTLSSKRTTKVTAKIASCPAGALKEMLFWSWENSRTRDETLTFMYDGTAIYPNSGMTTTVYGWETGTHRLIPGQESSWFPNDFMSEYKFALLSNTPTLTAKFASSISIKASGKGKKRKLTANAKRDAYMGLANAKGKVSITRNGKHWKTATLKKGKATVKLPRKGKARWQAKIGETSTQWAASSKTIRR